MRRSNFLPPAVEPERRWRGRYMAGAWRAHIQRRRGHAYAAALRSERTYQERVVDVPRYHIPAECRVRCARGRNARCALHLPALALALRSWAERGALCCHVFATCSPRARHVFATCSPRARHVLATCSPRVCHVLATCLPRVCHVLATCSPRVCHVLATCLPRARHVFATCSPRVCHVLATCLPRARPSVGRVVR